jgi:hypothetical protein
VLLVSRRAPQRLRLTDRVVPIACGLRDPRAPRRHRDVPSESMRYGLGFWLHESRDVVMLEGSNASSGAWPITRHLEEFLTS